MLLSTTFDNAVLLVFVGHNTSVGAVYYKKWRYRTSWDLVGLPYANNNMAFKPASLLSDWNELDTLMPIVWFLYQHLPSWYVTHSQQPPIPITQHRPSGLSWLYLGVVVSLLFRNKGATQNQCVEVILQHLTMLSAMMFALILLLKQRRHCLIRTEKWLSIGSVVDCDGW
jgi:hypothetical protein